MEQVDSRSALSLETAVIEPPSSCLKVGLSPFSFNKLIQFQTEDICLDFNIFQLSNCKYINKYIIK
jgi:hypothetical protein